MSDSAIYRAALLRRFLSPTKTSKAVAGGAIVSAAEIATAREDLDSRGLRAWVPKRSDWDEAGLPCVLIVRGTTPSVPAVAIVGARACDDYGYAVTAQVARDACGLEADVISGGAEGVDAAAHRGALDVGGRTTVVLAGGDDHPYPAAHRSLFEQIVAAGGAVVSAQWPTTRPARFRFLERNRVIAALSDVVVVTRARSKSGALSTAAHALSLGRPVLAVPGNVGEGLSAGPNGLLASVQALALTGPAVLARHLEIPVWESARGWDVSHRGDPSPFEKNSVAGSPSGQLCLDLDPVAQRVRDTLVGDTGLDLDTIVVRTGLPTSDVVAALTLLQLVGDVELLPGSHYRAC